MLFPLRKCLVIIMWMTHKLQMRATGPIFIVETWNFLSFPDTITIFNHNKKKDKNLITTNTVPLRGPYWRQFFLQNTEKNTKVQFFFMKYKKLWNTTNFTKWGPQGAPLLFLYEVSIVVLIDFIAILQLQASFSYK